MIDLFSLKRSVKIHGDRKALISLIDRSRVSEDQISGTITTFIDIDTSGTWFDASGMQVATEDQISSINIPPNLYPNAASFFFYFDTVKHKLFIQTYSQGKVFTINSAYKLFRNLADDASMANKYGDIKINVVQTHMALEKMFGLKVIKSISIIIERPNPDIFADDFEAQIEKHLSEANSRQLSLTYLAEKGHSLKPTKEIKDISKSALENGKVEVNGRDETGAVKISSENFPKVIQDRYDPDLVSEDQAFRGLVATNGQST